MAEIRRTTAEIRRKTSKSTKNHYASGTHVGRSADSLEHDSNMVCPGSDLFGFGALGGAHGEETCRQEGGRAPNPGSQAYLVQA